jgi:hypothetical protein
VFVCDNLAFSGEIKIARKHTRFIVRDLPGSYPARSASFLTAGMRRPNESTPIAGMS